MSSGEDYQPYPDGYPLLQELMQYSRDIVAGNIVACQKHKWACQRFLSDIKRQGKPDFPYVFDEAKALKFLNWMKLFKHRKGILQGQRINPHIIQKFMFGNIYGWVNKDTGRRRFRKFYWQVGRKNGKSVGLSLVATYELMADGEGASEVYCGATKVEQARIIWEEAEACLRQCKELKGKFKVAYGRIEHPRSGSYMRALSKEDRKSGDGLNPQCGIVDEYHAHETSEIYDILASGMGARVQPLLAIITSAGFDLSNPCYSVEYKYVSRILDPDDPVTNEQYFVLINELDKDADGNLIDDIADERVWVKANPILAGYPEGIEYLRGELKAAQDVPEKMNNFLAKNMGVWLDKKAQGYMKMDKWAQCGADVYPEKLKGRECVIGVDLSSKIDLTSVTFEFPPTADDSKYTVLSHSFMPEDKLVERRRDGRYPYETWARNGYITITDGAVVDYRFVMQYIDDKVAEYGWIPRELAQDPWNATQFGSEMADKGYVMVDIIQGMKTLSGPTKDFREQVYLGNVRHDRNPVLTWAMGNAVTRQDAQENIMLDKAKSVERIDPTAATVTAHVRAMAIAQDTCPYSETRGIIVI